MAFSDETHPLLRKLQERVLGWRGEIGLKTRPHLQNLKDALDLAEKSGIEADLFILVVAMCEWWFRVYHPTSEELESELTRLLDTPGYSPYGMFGMKMPPTSETPPAVRQYVNAFLRELWEEEATQERSRFLCFSLKPRIKELVTEHARPFLVAENRQLPAKPGGYGWWAPWVAAGAMYQEVRKRYWRRQDSTALDVASALLEGLTGKMPDKSQFHRQRRTIEQRAPRLTDALWNDFGKKLKDYENPYKRLESLLDMGTFDSQENSGGLDLLIGPN